MTDSTVTPGMRRDLEAMRRAVERFAAEHGAEARRRRSGPGAWDALAWELDLRVDLVEAARAELRAEERGEPT